MTFFKALYLAERAEYEKCLDTWDKARKDWPWVRTPGQQELFITNPAITATNR